MIGWSGYMSMLDRIHVLIHQGYDIQDFSLLLTTHILIWTN